MYKIMIISFLSLVLFSCKPKETVLETSTTPSLLEGTSWHYVGTSFHEKDLYINRPEGEKGLTLTFLENDQLALVLTVNSCKGVFQIEGEAFKVQLNGCTKICCETGFANDFSADFRSVNRYKLTETQLRLMSEEKILIFEKGLE